jgi:hypothetical protein
MVKGRALLRWNAIIGAVVMVSFLMNSPAVFGVERRLKSGLISFTSIP